MMSVKRRIRWPVWALAVLVLALAGTWLAQAIINTPKESSVNENSQSANTQLSARPQRIATADEYSRYVKNLTTGGIPVTSNNIFYPKEVDWTKEVVVAITFPLHSAKSITGASREVVDGVDSYVIEVLDAPSCVPSTQDDTQRAVLIAQPIDDTTVPAILRTSPNTAACEGLQ